MKSVVVVGSGASGVHFALRAIERGWFVTMVDVGKAAVPAVRPELDFDGLRTQSDDPLGYFLGENFESVLLPDVKGEYYGIPPHKQYIFDVPESERLDSSGFAPLRSYAAGGLAEAWTGGSYPLNDEELSEFPIGHADLAPHYSAVAEEIGLAGVEDDTARFFPFPEHLLEPVELDEHGEYLKASYERQRDKFWAKDRAVIGRSLTAVLTKDKDGRGACNRSGRCLWGCPRHSLYTPSVTLEKLKKHERFNYLDGLLAEWLEIGSDGRANSLSARRIATGERETIAGDRFVLAAGTLNSSRIFLDTWRRWKGEVVKLTGLMDNRQILMPFITLAMMGKRCETSNYQYHQLMMALEGRTPKEMIHCQVTTLKTAQFHAILQNAPVDLRGALGVFRLMRTSMGLVNINLHDTPRETNYVTIEPGADDETSKLLIRYRPAAGEEKKIGLAGRRVKRVLRRLGSFVPPGMTRVRPMGASVHYAGTLPMVKDPGPLQTGPDCRSSDVENLYFVDGSPICDLPAKNLTFTLMANARRVASESF